MRCISPLPPNVPSRDTSPRTQLRVLPTQKLTSAPTSALVLEACRLLHVCILVRPHRTCCRHNGVVPASLCGLGVSPAHGLVLGSCSKRVSRGGKKCSLQASRQRWQACRRNEPRTPRLLARVRSSLRPCSALAAEISITKDTNK
jgi:hypothetical protein